MLITLRRFLFNPLLDLFPSSCFGWRRFVLSLMGVKISKLARVNGGFRIYGSGSLYIEENVWIGRNCHFYTIGSSKITLGKSSEIGPECAFNCQTHEIGDSSDRAGKCIIHDISVGQGCWLGMRCTILCEKIGNGCVVGASSLVLDDIEDNSLCAGIPAKVKRKLQ